MQLGSGTFDPTVGLLYQGSSLPGGGELTSSIQEGSIRQFKRDYRLGNELRLDLYTMYQIRHDTVVEFQLNSSSRGDIEGEMDDVTDGLVGTSGMTGTGLTTPLWDTDNYGGEKVTRYNRPSVAADTATYPKRPVRGTHLYQDLNGVQLAEEYRVMLTWYIEIPTKKSRRYTGDNGPAKSNSGILIIYNCSFSRSLCWNGDKNAHICSYMLRYLSPSCLDIGKNI